MTKIIVSNIECMPTQVIASELGMDWRVIVLMNRGKIGKKIAQETRRLKVCVLP